MADSTHTISIEATLIFGNKRVHVIKISCTSYGTSGISVVAADCGLATLDYLIPWFVGVGAVANGPVSAWWDSTNGAIMLYKASNSGVDASTNITTAGYIYALAIGS